MFSAVVNGVDRLEVALSDCQGPYRTTKTAIMAIFQSCLHCQCHSLYIANIYNAMWKIEKKIKRSTPLRKDEIDSALRSLSYERKLKARGDGYYIIHPLHLPVVSLSSGYNQVKEKIAAKERKKPEGFVYYVQWENDPSHVKIGYSSQPAKRFVSFLTASPHRLVVLRVHTVAHPEEEFIIHDLFQEYRVNREWFQYDGSLKKHINELSCDVSASIDETLSDQQKEQILIHYF
jgi:hypothetical protein